MKNRFYVLAMFVSLFFISGCTTFHSAAAKGNTRAIERLYNDGENINEVDQSGVTPLIHSINLNQKESLLALLKFGADINTCDMAFGNTPLHHAVLDGNIAFIRILLERGADVSLRNKEGMTPLDIAQKRHKDEMIRLIQSYTHSPAAVKQSASVKDSNRALGEKQNLPVNTSVKTVQDSTVMSEDAHASEILNHLISTHETLAVRNFLNTHPAAISLIGDPRQQIRYVGPNGWRIIDLAERFNRGQLKEKEAIEHILAAALPYKHFTDAEIQIISHYGISTKIINAMTSVTP